MAGLEEQLNAVLSNPQMMQQIMAMAQNFTPPQEAPPPPQAPSPPPTLPNIDPVMLQKLSGLMNGGVDQNQQHLLKALGPYISGYRITKLEKAMQAAKMAKMATSLLGNFGQGR